MSEENVETLRQVFEALNSRDWAARESHHHPDFEWSDPPEFPGGGTHRGVGGVRRFMDDVLETGDEWHVEVDGIESVGGGPRTDAGAFRARWSRKPHPDGGPPCSSSSISSRAA
jgi:hypothetical protein